LSSFVVIFCRKKTTIVFCSHDTTMFRDKILKSYLLYTERVSHTTGSDCASSKRKRFLFWIIIYSTYQLSTSLMQNRIILFLFFLIQLLGLNKLILKYAGE